jgi:hypothetical protein
VDIFGCFLCEVARRGRIDVGKKIHRWRYVMSLLVNRSRYLDGRIGYHEVISSQGKR